VKTNERGADKLPEIRLRRGTKMLCPSGCGLQVAEFVNEKNSVFLSCHHLRTPGLLNPTPGHISVEHVIAGDSLANRLFPVTDFDGFKQKGKDLADVIGPVSEAERERWAA
jgi:hypothetical protein